MSAAGKRRMRRLQTAITQGSHTEAEWEFLVQYCGGRCVCCRAQFVLIRQCGEYQLPDRTKHPAEWQRLARDHIRSLVAGGSNAIENIQPLCTSCNSRKGSGDEQDWRPDGWQEALAQALAEGWRGWPYGSGAYVGWDDDGWWWERRV